MGREITTSSSKVCAAVMRRMLSIVLDVGYVLAGLAYAPIAIYRVLFAGRYRRGWAQRLGGVPRRYGERPGIWIHAVSVGEVNAIRTVVEALGRQLPFHEVYISTTTDTGYARAVSLFGEYRVFFFPFDFSLTMAWAFRRLRPSLVALAELEVWPNLVMEAKRHAVPVVVINGRVTETASGRYAWAAPLTRWLFGQLDAVLVQDAAYRQRFLQLGVADDRLHETGSLKWDTAGGDPSSPGDESLADAVGLDREKPVLVTGSTADTIEEEAIIRAYQQLRRRCPDLQLVIAPRKPERFDLVARLIRARGFKVVRRSQHPDGTVLARSESVVASPVVLLDTLGELRRVYALASVVIVGRTFVPLGGSDVMEIAALGKAMVIGPSVENFADAVSKLIAHQAAIQLDGTEKLASSIEHLLADRARLETIGQRAVEVVNAERGATERTVRHVCGLLGYEYDATERGIATPQLKQNA